MNTAEQIAKKLVPLGRFLTLWIFIAMVAGGGRSGISAKGRVVYLH